MADQAELSTQIAGEDLVLHAERAVFWPAQRALIIADLHLGKAHHFRQAGLALPAGGTSHDLQRLTTLLTHFAATQLFVLGDFVHGDTTAAPWMARWRAWRAVHSCVAITVIAGNHDRALVRTPQLAQSMGIDCCLHPIHTPPFVLAHAEEDLRHAPPGAPDCVLMSGHFHPVIRLPGLPRLPAFAIAPQQILLPAFSAFTGGQIIDLLDFSWLAVCAPGTIERVG